MTDQPLPLKPIEEPCPRCGVEPVGKGVNLICFSCDFLWTKEQPCFFCGNKLIPAKSNTWKGDFLFCERCVHTLEISPGKYKNAYCWKLLSEKEAELFASKNRLEVLHLTIRAKTVKIQEQAETIKIYEETLKSFALGLFSSRHAKLISQQALDRVRGK